MTQKTAGGRRSRPAVWSDAGTPKPGLVISAA